MIFVCEPTCKGSAHEKVNSGFLTALSLAFPSEKIRFYAEATHLTAIKATLTRDQVFLESLEAVPVDLPESNYGSVHQGYSNLFERIFRDVIASAESKVFFLSFSCESLYAVKEMKQHATFSKLKFNFVLHGIFEAVARDSLSDSKIVFPYKSLPQRTLLNRLWRANYRELPKKLWQTLTKPAASSQTSTGEYQRVTARIKDLLEWRPSPDYRYITLSQHATRNASQFIETDDVHIFTVPMPINFGAARLRETRNEFAKFAVYGGNADPLPLYNVAKVIAESNVTSRYEIRVISKNKNGSEGIPNVTHVGRWGHSLSRIEMEEQVEDIDFLLLLCDENQYRLTCSGVVFDALSLVKPIVHFDNECINQFNTEIASIGVRCYSFDEYVKCLIDIINNYGVYKDKINKFRDGLLYQRQVFAIEKAIDALRLSFRW
jgi:hypothetical protein